MRRALKLLQDGRRPEQAKATLLQLHRNPVESVATAYICIMWQVCTWLCSPLSMEVACYVMRVCRRLLRELLDRGFGIVGMLRVRDGLAGNPTRYATICVE